MVLLFYSVCYVYSANLLFFYGYLLSGVLQTDKGLKFTLFRKDRDTRGGGVLIAVRQNINCSLLSSPSDLEVLAVEFTSILPFPLILCVVYSPPNPCQDYFRKLLSYLHTLFSTTKYVMISTALM